MAAPNSLVAVFATDGRALEAARRVRKVGVDDRSIRVGESLDALASVRGEMREEALGVTGSPTGPYPRSAVRGLTLGTLLGSVAGLAIVLPFAAIPMGGLELTTRLLIVAAVGLVFGAFLGWFLGGAFGLERPEQPLAAARGTTLAVPDSDAARQVLLTSGTLRVDVVSAAGEPVATLASYDPGLRHTAGEIARNALEESRRG
jgi:hypothetical protein